MSRRKLPPHEKQLHISVCLPPEHHTLLAALGRQDRRSVSALVRFAVEEYLRGRGLIGALEVKAS